MGDELVQLTKQGKPRKLRPNGEYYSENPSIRMSQLKEDGRVGGEFGKLGGRPRKPRAAEELAEHARKRTQEMKDAFDRALSSDSPKVATQAANDLIAIERAEANLQLDEDKFEGATREELENAVLNLLGDPEVAAALGIEEGEVVDAQVIS